MKSLKNICIIDDDPIFVYGAKRMMKEADIGSTLSVYENGNDALESLQEMCNQGEKLPSLIFLDLNMPIMNGWDFLEEFVKLPEYNKEATSIYVISSSVDPRDLMRIKETQTISGYILKPLTSDDILNIIAEAA